MKLIFCPHCHDIIKLDYDLRSCKCGRANGKYEEDGINATINSVAIPLGFANNSFINALRMRPKSGLGERFEAFIIPEKCDTISVKEETDD